MQPGDLAKHKLYATSVVRVIEVFTRLPGMSRAMAEVEFVENNPFVAKRHRVYVSDLEPVALPWEGGEACSS